MPASKKLLWLLIALMIPASCVLKGWLVDSNNRHFVEVLATSRARLDQSMVPASGDRLLIAGGSNALSSYDSAAISQALDMPVYNLGVLGEGLDVRNMFRVVEERARSGNTVVLSALSFLNFHSPGTKSHSLHFASGDWQIPSNGVDVRTPLGVLHLTALPIFTDVTLIRSLASFQQLRRVEHPVREFNGTSRPEDHAILGLGSKPITINHQGDWIDCTRSTNAKPLVFDPQLIARSSDFIAAAHAFVSHLRQRNVNVYFVMPTVLIREPERSPWQQQIGDVVRQFSDVVFIDTDRSWQLNSDSSQFCDTNAHLLRANAGRNSRPIINAIRARRLMVSR